EQFQVVVNGWEIIKAYSELVDPKIQAENFAAQSDALERGDEEATSPDDDFVLAMEYGIPPQSGWGMGIERVFSILTEQENLRDVVLFPLMRSEKKEGESEDDNS
ncbi:lysine--tRNA ligase, partial [Candidatus Gracilibacteria bacterium]